MRKELTKLRLLMKSSGIDVYVIPTSDCHGSEYVGDYFKCREYISGFTGSAGTLVVTASEAGLWTDGRYFIQAENQLKESGIDLRKMGNPKVPTISGYLKSVLHAGMVLGYDGSCVMESEARLYRQIAQTTGATLSAENDLVGRIWAGRPALSCEKAWILPDKYAGEKRSDKIGKVRQAMAEKGADLLLLASLCDICWLLNVRGNDVESTPVVLSYLTLTDEEVCWYVQDCVSQEIREEFKKDGIRIRDYERIYEDLSRIPGRKTVWYDPEMTNSLLVSSLPANVKHLEEMNPTMMLKAVKNPVEVENERQAHIRDGVAVTRFIYWLKTRVGKEKITEISAGDYINKLRRDQENFVENSFDPIIAYGPHGALPHYSASPSSNVALEARGFLLADTGGHYLEGTTDITRTIAVGELTEEEKEIYTMVLRGHIGLSDTRFLSGCTGQSLDTLARTPLWDQGRDYDHGTGHGVGYLLSVHEGPNSFRYQQAVDPRRQCVLQEGMITSNEPACYLEGKFGVRIENLVVCRKDHRPGFDRFLCFETLTMAPYERAAIIPERLTEKERNWLNAYQEKVYETLAPLLSKEEADWLYKETRAI